MLNQRQKKEIAWIIRDKYQNNKNHPDLEKDIKRLITGEPVDYIIGWKPFLNCRIDLSLKPLIPRTETEYWTEKALADINERDAEDTKILDIFSGSGCVGISILKNTKNVKVDFGEKEIKEIKQININLQENNLINQRYRVIKSNLFKKITDSYDYILANPPYIASEMIGTVDKSVLDWEPKTALFGGKKGLEIINLLLKQARKHLKTGGKIYLEFGEGQEKNIAEFAGKYKYNDCRIFPDQFKRSRWAIIVL